MLPALPAHLRRRCVVGVVLAVLVAAGVLQLRKLRAQLYAQQRLVTLQPSAAALVPRRRDCLTPATQAQALEVFQLADGALALQQEVSGNAMPDPHDNPRVVTQALQQVTFALGGSPLVTPSSSSSRVPPESGVPCPQAEMVVGESLNEATSPTQTAEITTFRSEVPEAIAAPPRARHARQRSPMELAGSVADGVLAFLAATTAWLVVFAFAPTAFGWDSRVVISGSMMPKIRIGDVVVIQRTTRGLKPGGLVTFHDQAIPGRIMTHRLVKQRDDGQWITRGDANRSDDSTPLPESAIIGQPRMVVPVVGLPTYWRTSGKTPVGPLLVAVLALVLLVAVRTAGANAADRHRRRVASVPPDPSVTAGLPHQRSAPNAESLGYHVEPSAVGGASQLEQAPPQEYTPGTPWSDMPYPR